MVFDDTFNTVSSVGEDESPPTFWNEIHLEACTLRIPLDPNTTVNIQDDWLTTESLEENPGKRFELTVFVIPLIQTHRL